MKIDDKELLIEIEGNLFHCAMDVTLSYIGGKWKSVVLWYLRKDKKRFTELSKLIPQITDRMLSITLKQLEDDGLIKREVFTKKPPLKVEYSMTEFGKSLIPVLDAVATWGREITEFKGRLIEAG
jgi:DNA-binding HxlR family transcriptional regulator